MTLVFKFKPLGYFQTSVVLVEPRSLVRLSCLHLVYGPHEGAIERTRPWESLVAQIATGPWCLLKVRLCSPLQLVTLLYRCVFRLLPTPSSSTSQSLHARIFPVSFFCTYIYCLRILISIMCRISSKKYMPEETSWSYCVEA